MLINILMAACELLEFDFKTHKSTSDTAIVELPDQGVRVELSNKSPRGFGKASVIVSSIEGDFTDGFEFSRLTILPEVIEGSIKSVQVKAQLSGSPVHKVIESETHKILKKLRVPAGDPDQGHMSGENIWQNLLAPAMQKLSWDFESLDIQPFKVTVYVPNQGFTIVISTRKADMFKGGNILLYIDPFEPYCFTTKNPEGLAEIMGLMVSKARFS